MLCCPYITCPVSSHKSNSILTLWFLGWLFKIELQKPEELDTLMDEAVYKNFLKDQAEEHN